MNPPNPPSGGVFKKGSLKELVAFQMAKIEELREVQLAWGMLHAFVLTAYMYPL
jgi:hypothetical protein